ncbi:MAG: universal stress protein, partial [Balneolaceae bacterium]|nr:universal stress protein [Balneolaceae bacterium]
MSLQISHILFPTDFSAISEKALPFALELAKRYKASLTMMHTIEEPYDFAPMLEDIKKQVNRKVNSLFDEKLEEISKKKEYRDLNIKTSIQNGRISLAIMDEAKLSEADLIVMGTTGASGLQKVLFGSNASEIILKSKVPVLVVPKNSGYSGLEHITFLTDYNDGDLKALEQTAELAELFDSHITVLHVARDRNLKTEIMHRGFKEIAAKQIDYEDIDYELIIQNSFIAGVADFLETRASSLITMVRYKKP